LAAVLNKTGYPYVYQRGNLGSGPTQLISFSQG